MTSTIKLDGNWSSFQLANSAPPLSVTDSAIAPSARMLTYALGSMAFQARLRKGSFRIEVVRCERNRHLCSLPKLKLAITCPTVSLSPERKPHPHTTTPHTHTKRTRTPTAIEHRIQRPPRTTHQTKDTSNSVRRCWA